MRSKDAGLAPAARQLHTPWRFFLPLLVGGTCFAAGILLDVALGVRNRPILYSDVFTGVVAALLALALARYYENLRHSAVEVTRLAAEVDHLSRTAELRRTEERFHTTVDEAPIGITHVDATGRWIYVNQQFCDMLGYTPEELLHTGFATVTPESFLPQDWASHWDLMTGRIRNFTHEKQYLRKNGDAIWVNLTVSLVRDEDGRPAYSVCIVEDITERKRNLEALHNADKLLAAGRLAAAIAHELNNPIAGMFNLVYLLRTAPAIDRHSQQLLDTLDMQLRRMSDVTKRVLTFYRETTAPELVDVCSIIEEVLDTFKPEREANSVTVKIRCSSGVTMTGFPGELRHAFSNIVRNSLDALAGVNEAPRLHVRARASFDWRDPTRNGVRISFCDNGPGIPNRFRAKLYDPFFSTKAAASGLGLWVAKGIVDKHGGSIRFRSRETGGKRGTIFSIFLPATPPGQMRPDLLCSQIGRELLEHKSC
ncbi:MAG TPA: PAS domain S-box protein [Terriglobales bacterium]|nr:PAS domain S-box protein [Terriglobales bacterium]